MGKLRVIAETGAGQQASPPPLPPLFSASSLQVYMGEEDVRRQRLNVFKMKGPRSEVVTVKSGSRTLRDAINEAMRDWMATVENTHLHHRQRRGTAPLSHDGPRFSSGNRQGGAGAVSGADRPLARCGDRLRRRRQQLGRHLPSLCRRLFGRAGRCRGGGPRRPTRERHAADPEPRKSGRAARHFSYVLQDDDGQTARCTRSRPASITRASGPSTASGRTPAVSSTRVSRTPTRSRPSATAPGSKASPALETPTRWWKACARRHAAPATNWSWICFSGRGDKDCFEVAELQGEKI